MGPAEHARKLFVEPYAGTFLPLWSLWATGTLVPLVELAAGALVILGLRIREALIALGFVLVLVVEVPSDGGFREEPSIRLISLDADAAAGYKKKDGFAIRCFLPADVLLLSAQLRERSARKLIP